MNEYHLFLYKNKINVSNYPPLIIKIKMYHLIKKIERQEGGKRAFQRRAQ